ncbi:MAG: hypothetical protein DRI79_00100 [Chloroflexi bacterium]|nr:MAG: hypothetical protein DRI80_01485 [Chloroflexota bacterium]RLC92608.1 MAG: hypothetical protein DRI79_00100 [Chloroflexota bacterium]HEY67988.1 hypothetical protein [Thermoflexia bacterium]
MPTKLGPHVLQAAEDLSEYIEAGVAVAKFVGDWGIAKDVPAGVLVIGRKHQGDYDAQQQKAAGKTPLEAAQQFIQDQLPTYQSNPHIKYWEGHNEPVWNDEEGMGWYAQFEVERMQLMADLGLKCVIGNFATGTPPLDLWPAFFPALQVARQYEAILGLHEYSCPWIWWMTGNHQLDPNDDQGDEGWTTLRYRKVYRQHLIPNGLGNVPLVITECGIDPLVNPKPPGVEGGTWKQLGGFWAEHDNEPDKADYYFRQLVWYDKELQKDDYVVGATIFTWGSFGPPWSDFDVAGTDVAKKLIAYTQADPARPFKYPEVGGGDEGDGEDEGEGEGEKPRGQPRVQYERTYVLLPPNADAAWARAVVESTWDQHKYTIGSSADDAGIGDLDVRRVIAINPQEWPGPQTLAEFYAQYYPGVEYKAITAATPAELAQQLASE